MSPDRKKFNTESNHAPDDIISAILGYMTGSSFTADPRAIQEAFFTLKGKYPELFKQFTFAEGDRYPYSPVLERVIPRLQSDRFINSYGSDFTPWVVSESGKKYIEENILPCFSDAEKQTLKEAAKEFEQICGVKDEI